MFDKEETVFLTAFHKALEDATKPPVPEKSVKIYWRILQARCDARWRLPQPSDAYFACIAAEMTATRRLDAIYRTPEESAWAAMHALF
jgi:hypothetical protein